MSALNRVLAAAGVPLLESATISEDDAHARLLKDCGFYRGVHAGAAPSPDVCSYKVDDDGDLIPLTPHTPEASTVPKPTRPPGGPGLFHIKGRMLPPYIQHLYFHLVKEYGPHRAYGAAIGIVKKWAAGINPGGKGKGHRTHADVRAAASKNIAEWAKDKADAHRHEDHKDGAKKHHELAATVALAAPRGRIVTAPGAKPIKEGYGLYQVPSQPVSASPPLPPGTPLPTVKELNKLGDDIEACGYKSDLITGAAKHARVAATKMAANQPIDSLHALRACQTGLRSANLAYNASLIPVANVWSSSLVPAEQSSAQASMYAGLQQREKFRALHTRTANAIDSIRRHYFHGMYNGLAWGRFSNVELANDVSTDSGMIYLRVPDDLLPDGYPNTKMADGSSVPPHITIVFLGKITPLEFEEACNGAKAAAQALPPLHGYMAGLDYFEPTENSDGKRVAYAPVRVDGVRQLRGLLEHLAAPSSLPFSPHVTLAYLGPDDDPPPPVTSTSLCFAQVMVRRGNQERAYAFTGHHLPHPIGGRHARPSTTDSALAKVLRAGGDIGSADDTSVV